MSKVPSGHERRMVVRKLDSWRQAKGGDEELPFKEALEQDFVEIAPLSFVLEMPEGSNEPNFVSIGAEIEDATGENLVGKPVSAVASDSLLGHALESLPLVVEKSVPATNSSMYKEPSGQIISFRSILMPLSASSGNVNFILGAVSFREEQNSC